MIFKILEDLISGTEYESILIEEPTYKDLTTPIYHYTSPAGLLGIVSEDSIKLQFTRYDCVNDTSEGKNVLENYIEACRQLFANNEIDEGCYNAIKIDELMDEANFDIETVSKDGSHYLNVFVSEFQAYICCFSRDNDSLPMWNYYSKEGKYEGYSIGLNRLIFIDNKSDIWNQKGVKCKISSVIYDNNKKIENIKQQIRLLNKDCDDIEEIKSRVLYLLLDCRLFFKSECFAHENEVRAVIYVPNEIPKHLGVSLAPKVEYKSKGAYIIPYITVTFNCKEYLKEIIIGPLSEKEISHSTVDSFLKQRAYKAEIKDSKIPIRF